MKDKNMDTKIDLPNIVVDTVRGNRARIVSVVVRYDSKDTTDTISTAAFLSTFVEYIDPKDVEIARLRKQVEDLKVKARKPRKSYRTPDAGEILEMRALLAQGTVGHKIATEYGVSASYVSKLRGEMKKENPDG